jgi:hypothetical protein
VAVIVVLFTTTTWVAAVPPNVTVAPEAKFVPVIVTAVPPVVGPLFGDTLLTVILAASNVVVCSKQTSTTLENMMRLRRAVYMGWALLVRETTVLTSGKTGA